MSIEYILLLLGVAISSVAFVCGTAVAVLGYFFKKRDTTIEEHERSIQDHRDRLTRVEMEISGLTNDVSEIKGDVKTVRTDVATIKESTGGLRILIESKFKS